MLDLGMSALQLDDPTRGFSFRYSSLFCNYLLIFKRKTHNGPLDMRMDVHSGDITAADVVNNLSLDQLAEIIETVLHSKLFCSVITFACISTEKTQQHANWQLQLLKKDKKRK